MLTDADVDGADRGKRTVGHGNVEDALAAVSGSRESGHVGTRAGLCREVDGLAALHHAEALR
jgi:hypothetical protein